MRDETLAAYVDGSLTPDEAAAVEAAAARDRAVRERIERLRAQNRRNREALEPLLREPLPAALLDRIAAAAPEDAIPGRRVVPLPRRRVPRVSFATALAASLALVVGAGGGYLAARLAGTDGTGALHPAGLAAAALSPALDTLPSGAEAALADGAIVEAIATFRVHGGALCREIELTRPDAPGYLAVACRTGGTAKESGGWRLTFLLASEGGAGYAPATGLETLETYLDSVAARDPLPPEAEAEALALSR